LNDERYKAVTSLLSDKKLTTIELEIFLKGHDAQCPDDLARTLNVMRRKGLIKGEVSTERGGWVWWVEDQTE
jgi:hypothetical protein